MLFKLLVELLWRLGYFSDQKISNTFPWENINWKRNKETSEKFKISGWVKYMKLKCI